MYSRYSPAFSSVDSQENSSFAEMDTKPIYTNSYEPDILDLDSHSMEEMMFSNVDELVPDIFNPPTTFTYYASEYNSAPAQAAPVFSADQNMVTTAYNPMSMQQQYPNNNYMPITTQCLTTVLPIPAQPTPVAAQPPKPRRKGGRKPKNDPLPPHLEERRRLRRIRNREAAQQVRESRLIHTDKLTQEIATLEQQTRQTEQLIESLRQAKEQCEFILSSHKSQCFLTSKRVTPTLSFTNCSLEHRRSSSNSNTSPEELQSSLLLL